VQVSVQPDLELGCFRAREQVLVLAQPDLESVQVLGLAPPDLEWVQVLALVQAMAREQPDLALVPE
jgi:hypothetical protein